MVRPLLFSTDSAAYFLRPLIPEYGYSVPFLVPIVLSLHMPLSFCYKPVSWGTPMMHHGFS